MKSKLQILTLFLFTFLFCSFFANSAFAANFTLSGSVKDSSANPIVGATVLVNDANSDNTTTDSSGNYSLSIPQGTYNVQVTPPSGSNFSPAIAAAIYLFLIEQKFSKRYNKKK